jgi:hypothetical protein
MGVHQDPCLGNIWPQATTVDIVYICAMGVHQDPCLGNIWPQATTVDIVYMCVMGVHQDPCLGNIWPQATTVDHVYMCYGYLFYICFYGFLIVFWICSDDVVCFDFHFIIQYVLFCR